MRGNVIDMAVGVVIGAAFGKIVSSLVNDIIMPLVGVVTGGMNFTDFKWVIQKAVTDGQEIITPEVSLNWGTWVQTIVNFLIVAFSIFVAIKFMNRLRKRKDLEDEAEAATADAAGEAPTKDQELLTEIRDLLKQQAEEKK